MTRVLLALVLFACLPLRSLAADLDADFVDDSVDNCVGLTNPVLVTPMSFQVTTGGQLDDDADGRGNECDADFDGPPACGPSCPLYVSLVLSNDVLEMKASLAKNRNSDTCGVSGVRPCAIFDLAPSNPAVLINVVDQNRFNTLESVGVSPAGCVDTNPASCPGACVAGTSGSCACPGCSKP